MSELRLPQYFPTFKKQCIEVTKEFFDCFTEKAKKIEKRDTTVGQRGLQECKDLLVKYTQCMDPLVAAEKEKLASKKQVSA